MNVERIYKAEGAAFVSASDMWYYVVLPVDGEWLISRASSIGKALEAIDSYDGTGEEVVPYLTRDEAIEEAAKLAGEGCIRLVN